MSFNAIWFDSSYPTRWPESISHRRSLSFQCHLVRLKLSHTQPKPFTNQEVNIVSMPSGSTQAIPLDDESKVKYFLVKVSMPSGSTQAIPRASILNVLTRR